MSVKNSSGTVLIRERTLLPLGLTPEVQAFLPGWRIVRGVDAKGLSRQIEESCWNFFCLAGEAKAAVFGRETPAAVRRAAKHILAKHKAQKCNALEITRVVSTSFLGIPFVSVSANFRHIQHSIYLIPQRETAAGIESMERPVAVEPGTKDFATQTLGL